MCKSKNDLVKGEYEYECNSFFSKKRDANMFSVCDNTAIRSKKKILLLIQTSFILVQLSLMVTLEQRKVMFE